MHQQHIEIRPVLPEPIVRLDELARNLWFSWNADARSLFYRLDRGLWREVGHNPILFLRRISQQKLENAARDRTYLTHYNRIMAAFDVYASDAHTWYQDIAGDNSDGLIAYFSAEFGIHESLPIFSGGLGVLAGDHCKSASDMGLPFVGVGLLYRKGYFTQHIDAKGWQHDLYEEHDFDEMPVSEVTDTAGKPIVISVELEHRNVQVKVWKASVGRIPLYLLDTDIEANAPHDRLITHQLYGGDMEMRICQEIVLGMGGVRALAAIGIDPAVWHMNEGHSVFLGLERIRQHVQGSQMGFYDALELVRGNTVFTTHTPVAAGHDAFPLALKDRYFRMYWESMGLTRHEFLALGLETAPDGRHELFSLTVLALNLSGWCNGVSRLHGQVSSEMWKDFWPGVPASENLITHVTNGVHTLSWLAPEMMDLFDQHLGVEWRANLTNAPFWEGVDRIPDSLFWGVHQNLKRRMIERIRERCVEQLVRNGEGAADIREVESLLNPDYLTIGFARRFATYKRATLLFQDMDRLARIISNSERPVQFVFAGKAHPADVPGQELIQKIYQLSRQEPFKGRVVLVEGYDIAIARYLVSGVDVWLNTPRRPFEASGTSGMKVTMNGGINFSVLDGWWCEAAQEGVNGWSIGDEREFDDENRLAIQDSKNLYQHLEDNIVPTYYQRSSQGIPDAWIRIAKGSIKTIPPMFNTDRMVGEYAQRFYFPAMAKGRRLAADQAKLAIELARWKNNMRQNWSEVSICWDPQGHSTHKMATFGEKIQVSARVRLGDISPGDVLVEAFIVDRSMNGQESGDAARVPLKPKTKVVKEDGWISYKGTFMPPDSGCYSLTVRATPHHPEMIHPHELGLICWLTHNPNEQGEGFTSTLEPSHADARP